MPSNGNNYVYSPYVGNTAASSSTTMIVPSLSPPSEKDDEDEDEANEMVEKEPHAYSHPDKKQKQQYDYSDLQQPLECHPKPLYNHHANIETPETTAIPFSPAFASNDSSYFPTHAQSTVSAPLPRFTSATSSTSSDSFSSSAVVSPKKRAKRWIMATLMIIVGLLIALTFILIGLGKAFSHHHDEQKQDQPQVITVTSLLTSSSIHPATVNAFIPITSSQHLTTTVLVIPTTVTTTFPSPTFHLPI